MAQTYTQNVVHIVFSTKDRRRIISQESGTRLWLYITGICKNLGIQVHAIRGMADHIHLLIQLPPTIALAKAVLTIKANSSRWMSEQGHRFRWQKGYGAFSVSHSMVPRVVRYINEQEKHHARTSFETEFVALLKRHDIAYDPQFVYD